MKLQIIHTFSKKIKIMPDFQRIIGRTEFGALTHNWSVNNANCPRTVEEDDISGRFVNTINSLQLSLVGKKVELKINTRTNVKIDIFLFWWKMAFVTFFD